MSSIASNHDLSSLCYRRIQHTDNLPLIIGIGVGIPVCLLLLVIMIYLLYVTGGFSIQIMITSNRRHTGIPTPIPIISGKLSVAESSCNRR